MLRQAVFAFVNELFSQWLIRGAYLACGPHDWYVRLVKRQDSPVAAQCRATPLKISGSPNSAILRFCWITGIDAGRRTSIRSPTAFGIQK
jgi:hypothetical protein